jgi:hypothetical protein
MIREVNEKLTLPCEGRRRGTSVRGGEKASSPPGGCQSGRVRVGLFSRVENRNSSTALPAPGLKARLSQRENLFAHPHPVLLRQTQSIYQKPATKIAEEPPLEVVQLSKIGYATMYEDASPSRREGREVRAGRGSM